MVQGGGKVLKMVREKTVSNKSQKKKRGRKGG